MPKSVGAHSLKAASTSFLVQPAATSAEDMLSLLWPRPRASLMKLSSATLAMAYPLSDQYHSSLRRTAFGDLLPPLVCNRERPIGGSIRTLGPHDRMLKVTAGAQL